MKSVCFDFIILTVEHWQCCWSATQSPPFRTVLFLSCIYIALFAQLSLYCSALGTSHSTWYTSPYRTSVFIDIAYQQSFVQFSGFSLVQSIHKLFIVSCIT